MVYFHKNLSQEKWNSLSKDKQILNIAAELLRAKNLLSHGDLSYFYNSLDRAFELIDLTANDRIQWHQGGLKELLRLRERLAVIYLQEKKDLNDLIMLLKHLLYFDKNSAMVQI